MKIGIQTWGSYGDIRPFLALAEGLHTAGHDVTLVITSIDSASYDSAISRSGVTIRMVSSPVIQDKEVLRDIEGEIFSESDPLKQTQSIIEKLFFPAESAMYEAAIRLCEENDIVIGHFFHYPLNVAAERTGRPYVSVALVHSTVPSTQPPPGIPNLGVWGNRVMWSLVKSIMNKKLKKYPDRLREQQGLGPARDLLEEVWASKHLTLVAVSPLICGSQRDWPDHYQVCGFMNRQGGTLEAEVPQKLQTFITQGESPIYMTFGSVMSGGDPTESVSLLAEAAQKASVRAIIQAPGWRELGFVSSATVHYVDSVPHAEIFPHCKAIVHHGGAGTSQAALLAGKPSIVVAHTSEQEFWGRALEKIGVAPKPLSRKTLRADPLAANIQHVANLKALSDSARRTGIEMVEEDGVATAVRLIHEKFIR